MFSVLSLLENTIEGLHSRGQRDSLTGGLYPVPSLTLVFDCKVISLGSEEDRMGKRPLKVWAPFLQKKKSLGVATVLACTSEKIRPHGIPWGLLITPSGLDSAGRQAQAIHHGQSAVPASGVSISCHLIQGSAKAPQGPHVLP